MTRVRPVHALARSLNRCDTCGGGIYECGSLLSATAWDLWQRLDVSEPRNADAIVRKLVFSSIPLHTGSHIDPTIAIDLLTLDDDDGPLQNGTPQDDEICGAFGQHGMSCPPMVNGLVVKGASLVSCPLLKRGYAVDDVPVVCKGRPRDSWQLGEPDRGASASGARLPRPNAR